MKKLYVLVTRALGEYYVVANDPTQALESLKEILDRQDYGYRKDREVLEIRILAKSPQLDWMSSEDKLIIV